MGMFDWVKYEMDCPNCGEKISGFQSKDGMCILAELDFRDVNNFYTSCGKCDTWIEFDREDSSRAKGIEDYRMTKKPSRES